ncbi:MAG: phosphate ABC transporter substrate-binding protein PstS [Kineosporiaceae bacterium]|nr:phosphate ABC transporter substrate-binding protein PstS [Aeromicrobium sp.]
MNRNLLRSAAPLAVAVTLALGLSACGAANETPSSGDSSKLSGTLNAGGASSQESAIAAWKKAFQTTNPGTTINYDPIGSGGGREQFIAGGLNLVGSDAFLDDEELAKAKTQCKSDIVEVPVYVSPVAIIFNLPGVTDLNLTPEVVGGIFEGKIKTWDAAAIKADNPDAKLPSTRISPVHRSDDSGTTENFTDYLDQASNGSWTGGKDKVWPVKSGEAAAGTSGVVSAVTKGEGTIGYADASQAGALSVAKIKVGDEFVAYSPEAAAAVLDASKQVEGRSETDIAINVDRKISAAGVYPIVLVSYQIACEKYADKAQADLVKSWLTYVASSAGQAVAAKDAGAAPLSADLSTKVTAAIAKITVS